MKWTVGDSGVMCFSHSSDVVCHLHRSVPRFARFARLMTDLDSCRWLGWTLLILKSPMSWKRPVPFEPSLM